MEQNVLHKALIQLPEKLAALGHRIGSYSGHISTSKGVTLLTAKGSLFLYHSLISKLLWQPDAVTEEDLARLASNLR